MFKCYCGLKFESKRILAIHIGKKKDNFTKLEKEKFVVESVYGKFIVEDAITRYLNKEVSIYCLMQEKLDLNKYFILLGIKRTSKEERKTERYKNKLKKSLLEKYGVDNISKSDEYKKKKINTIMANYGVTNAFYIQSVKEKSIKAYKEKSATSEYKQEFLKKYKKTCQDKYGVDNVSQIKEIKEKNSKTMKEKCASMTIEERRKMTEKARNYWCQQDSWVSKIELRVRSVLKKIGVEFKTNETLFGYNYDIVIGDLIIEINGDFWHGNPLLFKSGQKLFENLTVDEIWEKDALKKEIAEKNGKKIYILWETEINKYSDDDLEIILKKWLQ